jgi:hypothetical protein
MSTKRKGAAAVMLVDQISPAMLVERLIVCGGQGAGMQALSSVESYDPKAKSWSLMPPMIQKRWRPSAAVVAGQIYVCGTTAGGSLEERAGGEHRNSMERYEQASGSWLQCPRMPLGDDPDIFDSHFFEGECLVAVSLTL